MADLRHITQFMPTLWHKDRVVWAKTNPSFSFDTFLRKRHPYKTISGFQGDLGEMQVASWIHNITDFRHAIFNKVLVPNEASVSGDTEIDLIWAGQHGVLVLEVKAYRGIIEVYGDDHLHLLNPKKDKGYTSMKSPVGQCIGQAQKIRRFLKKKGFDIPVRGLLVFPAANEIRVVDNPRIPMLKSQEDLFSFNDGLPTRLSQSTLSNVLITLGRMKRK